MWFNILGRAKTANLDHVLSMINFLYEEKQYLGVSGDGQWFEIFDVSMLEENEFLSRDNSFCLFTFFGKDFYFFVN